MKKLIFILLSISLPLFLNGCEAIGDIFKAGVWVGIIIVIAIVAVIAFIVKLFSK